MCDAKFSASLSVFFNCGVWCTRFVGAFVTHFFSFFSFFSFFLSLVFLALFDFFCLSFVLSLLFCNCSRLSSLVSFVSRKRQLFSFLSKIINSGVFKQKLKRMPFFLFLCTNNSNSDECAKRRAVVYIIVASSREAALCVRVCARESKRERACDTTFLKRKKMYGKEFGSESNRETEKIRLLFSRESERERVFSRVFEGEKQREAFEMALRVWSFQVNAR